jgi:hypothetical protein
MNVATVYSFPSAAPGDFGQIAEGNDFHRRNANEVRADQMIAREAQAELNRAEWRRRIAEHVDNGEHETAENIRKHLANGYD